MKPFVKILSASVIIAALALSTASFADNGKGKGKGQEKKAAKTKVERVWQDDGDDRWIIKIDLTDRDVIQSYMRKTHRKNCPPGLAKKNNGCLPPGIAKKYSIGKPLPDDIGIVPVARELLDLLRPAPKGYMYVGVDKDILLVSEASKKVIDAVTLLSAVGS